MMVAIWKIVSLSGVIYSLTIVPLLPKRFAPQNELYVIRFMHNYTDDNSSKT